MESIRSAVDPVLGPPYRMARQIYNLARWISPILVGVKPKKRRAKRVLAIYDLTSQPFSIGDMIAVLEASLVVRENCGAEAIDFAIVYDRDQPACPDPQFASINEDNLLFHLASILPVAQVNQYLGSLVVFDSHAQLVHYIASDDDRYCVWPSAPGVAIKRYLYYTLTNDLLYEYFQEHGVIPYLTCRKFIADWAFAFYYDRVHPNVPVSVQIRNNKLISTVRNSRMDAWFDLFSHCASRHPVTFVVACAISEVDDRLRSFPNVIIAKDHGTTIEKDLAFIQTAPFHMGASSGPGQLVVYNPNPYLLVNSTLIPDRYRGLIREGPFVRFFFSGPLQLHTLEPETSSLLIDQFERFWATIDVAAWNARVESQGQSQKPQISLR
jgi:hypothetical protein